MNDEERPLTKKDGIEFFEALGKRLDAIERRLDELQGHRQYVSQPDSTYEQRIHYLEQFAASTLSRVASLESPGAVVELMLRVSEIERRLHRTQ